MDLIESVSEGVAEQGKVFLSYSRKDRERAQGIADALRSRHFGVFKDTDDILPTEEWKTRLEELIEEADTIVFLLSPHSATSEVCAWEVEYATALNKRIAPIVIEDTEGADIPPLLARLNFIFCTPRDPFQNAVETLVNALSTDIEWIREHTRLAGLARRWEEAGRSGNLLLRGQEIVDAEAWRDGRPKDSPEITAGQTALITASRKATAGRLRNWIIGSVAVAASAAVLAVFAYFQSVEADRQRIAAEANAEEAARQQILAEQSAAEAERQRAEAEIRRKEALKRLAADRLRVGDRPAGLQALMQADPTAPQIPSLMAGLRDGTTLSTRLFGGLPFSINGRLHITAVNAPPIPVEPFPAKYWLSSGGNTLLASETGTFRLLGPDGQILGQSDHDFAFQLCFAQFAEDGMNVYGMMFGGYSACSPRMVEVQVANSGAFETRVYPYCLYDESNTITLAGAHQSAREPEAIGELCLAHMDNLGDSTSEASKAIFALAPNITKPVEMAELRFPMRSGEDSYNWSTNRPTEPEAMTAYLISELRRLPLKPDDLEKFAVVNFEGAASGAYHAPDLLSDDRMELASSLYSWGGTGGEVYIVCSGPKGREATCYGFHTFSGFDGTVVDQTRPRFAVFGDGLTPTESEDKTANLWIFDAPGASPRTLPGIDVYGPITDVAFHPDGKMVVLTGSALLFVDPDDGAITALPAPEGANALLWFTDGEMVALSEEALHFSEDGVVFDAVPINLKLNAQTETPNFEPQMWMRATADESTFAAGLGDLVVIFDRELRAPLSDPYATGATRLEFDGAASILERSADGGFRLIVNGITYERSGYDGENPDARLDPNTPLK